MAKTPQANKLTQFRPISLSCFAQKIWEKWLANHIKLAVEAKLGPHQHGFRSGYQAPELVQVLLRIKEVAGEWDGTYVMLKVDIRRAFDRVSHSSFLIALMRLETSRRPLDAIAEEILFARVRPRLDALEADEDIRLFRGVRQGSPLSGILFIMIMAEVLRPLEEKWGQQLLGCQCGPLRYNHLLFADDVVLIGKTGFEIKATLRDLAEALHRVGLAMNDSKFQYIYGPDRDMMRYSVRGLPGSDQSKDGMVILGRMILGHNLPDDVQDLRWKKAKGWGRYHAYKKILRHHTSRRHKLYLVETCVLQTVLWMSNTWRPTMQICRELRGFHLAVLRAVFPKPPTKPPSGTHSNVHHSRWLLQVLAEEKRALADKMFLQRFHRWAGHIARSPHILLRQLLSYRDGEWWHTQHRNPWGLRHAGDKGNLYRWDQCLTDVHGFQWKELAQQRAGWKKMEGSFLAHFTHDHKRKRESKQAQEMSGQTPEQATAKDRQVPQDECTHGDSRKQRRSEVPSRVSTLKVRYKRKHTRQGDILKEYLVPLGTSDESALGQQRTRTRGAPLAQELKRRRNSSSWARAICEVGEDQPLIDLLVRPIAGGLQGGHDIFGLPARLESRGAGRGGKPSRGGSSSQPSSKDVHLSSYSGSTLPKHLPRPHPRRLHPRMPTSPPVSAGSRGGTNGSGQRKGSDRGGYQDKAETQSSQRRRRPAKEGVERLAIGTATSERVQTESIPHQRGRAGSQKSSGGIWDRRTEHTRGNREDGRTNRSAVASAQILPPTETTATASTQSDGMVFGRATSHATSSRPATTDQRGRSWDCRRKHHQ